MNLNGFYLVYVYITNKKDIKTYTDHITNRLRHLSNTEYFKVLDAYRLSLKKPKVQKQDISGKYLDDLLSKLI